jgi:hypothetical protein
MICRREVPVGLSLNEYLLGRYPERVAAVALGHSPFGEVPSYFALKRIAHFPLVGVAFSRVKKNANSFVMRTLAAIEVDLLGAETASIPDAKAHFTLPRNDIRSLLRIRGNSIFTVRRNPFSRTLSAFLEKFRDESYQRAHGPFELSPGGFTRFVLWLKDGNLRADRHWELQVESMLPLRYYTDILPQENLNRALGELLDRRGVAVPAELLRRARSDEDSHNQHAERRLQAFYSAEARDAVVELYRADFALLGYSTDLADAEG